MNTENASKITFFKKAKYFLEKYSPKSYSLILIVPTILFALGFLIWSANLYALGFTETEFIRSQFILTGGLFILISTLPAIIVRHIWGLASLIPNLPLKETVREYLFFITLCTAIIWFTFYVTKIFPSMPVLLGGGQPRMLSLITTSENMGILNSLNIKNGSGAKNQTENLCVAYEDSHQIYILREDRVLAIDKSLFQGFGSLPGVNTVMSQMCIEYAYQWTEQGSLFNLLVWESTIKNLWREISGQPKEFITIQQKD